MYEISFVTDPSVQPSSYILYCMNVFTWPKVGVATQKIFHRALRASDLTPLSKFLDQGIVRLQFLKNFP